MLDARNARKIAGYDPRTTFEKFIADLEHYTKIEASYGGRKMVYRVPEKYYHPDLITMAELELEEAGYRVYVDRQEDIIEVRW